MRVRVESMSLPSKFYVLVMSKFSQAMSSDSKKEMVNLVDLQINYLIFTLTHVI